MHLLLGSPPGRGKGWVLASVSFLLDPLRSGPTHKLQPGERFGSPQTMNRSRLITTVTGFFAGVLVCSQPAAWAKPLALHPENPHYFLYQDKPAILISSGEHYGAVLNLDFNYVRYLDELKSKSLNNTRIFAGAYVEPPGAFNITSNTLAPAPNRYICPWARSRTPGYANGGNKFDLNEWDNDYFRRLKDFVSQAARRDVIVEVNLFCPFYSEAQWELSPFNIRNNVNNVGEVPRTEVHTLDKHGGLLPFQEALVRKIVTELNRFDNLYYEICNEPYAGGISMDWQHRMVDLIVETEKKLKQQHLISLNIANGSQKIENPHPSVSIFNFHYATPPRAAGINYGLNKVIGDNETGFRGTNDLPYRVEAWSFILAGGGLFNHLDYSFAAGHEDGSFVYPATQPGGGNAGFRQQLKTLRDFIYGFDFVRMRPRHSVVKRGIPPNSTVLALTEPGQAYAIYLCPTPAPSRNEFSVRWTGKIIPRYSEIYTMSTLSNDGVRLWIDNKLVIDNWTDHTEHEDVGYIELKEKQRYLIKLEYYQNTGRAAMKLFWSSPSQEKEIVPASQLYVPTERERGLQGNYYVGKDFDLINMTRTDATIDFDWSEESPFRGPIQPAVTNQIATLAVDLLGGTYQAEWINPQTGQVEKKETFQHRGGIRLLESPSYSDDIALGIKRMNQPTSPPKRRRS